MRAFVPDDLFELTWLGSCDIAADGSRVAVVVTRLDRTDDQYRSAIWIVDVAGGDCRPFTTGSGRDTAPRWSPDGRWLAFLREQPGEKAQLAVMPSAGSEDHGFSKRSASDVVSGFSPDVERTLLTAGIDTSRRPRVRRVVLRWRRAVERRASRERWKRRHRRITCGDARTFRRSSQEQRQRPRSRFPRRASGPTTPQCHAACPALGSLTESGLGYAVRLRGQNVTINPTRAMRGARMPNT